MTDLGTTAPLPAEAVAAPERLRGGRFWPVFAQNRMAVAGLVILGLIVAASLLGPLLSPYSADVLDVPNRYQTPTLAHPMGTDELGRDVLTRVLAGGRLSLAVGGLATMVALAIGITVGAVAGFRPGWVDNALMRLVDLALSLPDLFLLILVTSILPPSVITIVIVISIVRWMNVARLVRASFLSLREREFVEAARATGAGPIRIVLRHLLPNSLGPVIVAGTLGVASAIIAESTLSFLGRGVQPPASSWGSMLKNAQPQIFTNPWLAVFPGAMIFLTVISINFVGDGLRDALDPGTLRVHRGARRMLDELLVPRRAKGAQAKRGPAG